MHILSDVELQNVEILMAYSIFCNIDNIGNIFCNLAIIDLSV